MLGCTLGAAPKPPLGAVVTAEVAGLPASTFSCAALRETRSAGISSRPREQGPALLDAGPRAPAIATLMAAAVSHRGSTLTVKPRWRGSATPAIALASSRLVILETQKYQVLRLRP